MVVIDSTGHADNMLKMLHDSQTYDGIFLNTDTRLWNPQKRAASTVLFRKLLELTALFLLGTRTCDAKYIYSREFSVHSYFEEGFRKNVQATIPKGNMGYDQCTFPDTVAIESTFVAFF